MVRFSGRVKRFAFVSFLGTLAMLIAFVAFFRQINEENMLEHLYDHNEVLAGIFKNSLEHHGLESILGISEVFGVRETKERLILDTIESPDPDHGHAAEGGGDHHTHEPVSPKTTPESVHRKILDHFDRTIADHIAGLPILKVKLYNRNGIVVYSNDHREIGELSEHMDKFVVARNGEQVTHRSFREEYSLPDRTFRDIHIFEAYVPIRRDNDQVIGVFEVYSDLTDAVIRADAQERRMIIGVMLLLAASYSVLFMLFYRTDKALQREEKESLQYLQQVEQAKNELEDRVAERTAELESARFFLQSVIDGIADPVMVIDKDLKVTEMNRAARAMVPQERRGQDLLHCYEVSHRQSRPCDCEAHPCSFMEVIASGKTVKLLHRHFDASGQPRYVEVVSTPFRSVDGEMLGIIEVSHDVSDVVEARDRLQESERHIRAVMDTVYDAILTVDDQGVIRDTNRAAETIFGYAKGDLAGMDARRLFEDEKRARACGGVADFGACFADKVSQGASEVSVIRKDGSRVPAELWVGMLSLQGRVSYIAVFHDIRERKEAERELEQTRQQYFHQDKMAAIGQLAAGILHEVGNPIAAIAGSIQAIQSLQESEHCLHDECELFAGTRQHMSMIEAQVTRLGGITREIADFASPRPGERELLDLNTLVRSTTNLMRYDRRVQSIDLNLALDPGIPAVTGVADQLTQVLMNLVINSVDACESAGTANPEIRIGTKLEGDEIVLSVADNGSGMDAEVALHAREAFFTTKPAGKGTGLGLALCNSIVARHRGRLEIETEPGLGTSVNIVLPVDVDA